MKVSAGRRWKRKQWEFDWKVDSSRKLIQQLRVGARVCSVGSHVLAERALSLLSNDRHFFKRRARTKRGSKIINVRVSLLAAQMNSETDFSIDPGIEENLIDISFLAVTASAGCRTIWQPCDVRVIVVLIVPDNTLLRRLRVFLDFLPY